MEVSSELTSKPDPLCCVHASNFEPGTPQRHSLLDSVLTEAVLNEIKRQSSNGCLLCLLEEWQEENWD